MEELLKVEEKINCKCNQVSVFDNGREYELLLSWVKLSGMLKNQRITEGLSYNEAIVMLFLSVHPESLTLGELARCTGMLKSLANRTVNLLEKKAMAERVQSEKDHRKIYIKCTEEGKRQFAAVHENSVALAKSIISVIGCEDADAFIRIVKALENADFRI